MACVAASAAPDAVRRKPLREIIRVLFNDSILTDLLEAPDINALSSVFAQLVRRQG
jgi:hypothetical protein